MQNPNDGMMEKISEADFDKINSYIDGEKASKVPTFMDGTPISKDVALFSVGEKLMVKGGHFVVDEITEKGILLRGIRRPAEKTPKKYVKKKRKKRKR